LENPGHNTDNCDIQSAPSTIQPAFSNLPDSLP